MLNTHITEHGYTEVYVPYMVSDVSADAVSSLDKFKEDLFKICLLYTSDAADERSSVDLGGRRIIKKKKTNSQDCSG